jgi:molecular chaperone Hsp33
MSADAVFGFQLETAPARGRLVRLGPATLDPILRRHDYPRPAAVLLGEAIMLAASMGALLKFEGVLTVQAQGDGPIPLLVAEYRAGGGLRGYARLAVDGEARIAAMGDHAPAALLGTGALAITIDQGPDMTPMQGIAPLEGATLAASAEAYFERSEQTPTRIALTAGQQMDASGRILWRGGGMLMQRITGDPRQGPDWEGWALAETLFDTLTARELADPRLPPDRLLYRLFHEPGVRMDEGRPLADRCTCDAQRLTTVLKQFEPAEIAEMTDAQGAIEAKCQFCARVHRIAAADLTAG